MDDDAMSVSTGPEQEMMEQGAAPALTVADQGGGRVLHASAYAAIPAPLRHRAAALSELRLTRKVSASEATVVEAIV